MADLEKLKNDLGVGVTTIHLDIGLVCIWKTPPRSYVRLATTKEKGLTICAPS